MAPRPPPNEADLVTKLTTVRNYSSKEAVKEKTLEFLEDIVRGLLSQTYLKEYFAAFSTVLKIDNVMEASDILNLVNDNLKSGSQGTKGEKKIYATGRILAFGALLRSGKSVDAKTLEEVFNEFTIHAQRKGTFPTFMGPFIMLLLETLSKESEIEFSLDPIQKLIDNPDNPSRLLVAVKARKLGLKINCGILESIDELCEIVLKQVLHDDTNCLDQVFDYLNSTRQCEAFMVSFTEKLYKKNVWLLKAVISSAMKNQCPFHCLITRKIVTYLLKAFKRDNPADTKAAEEAFDDLLTWDSNTCNLTKKERLAAIRVLFEGVPNILQEYKFLSTHLSRFLTYLSSKELDELTRLCEIILQNSGNRVEISTISFLGRITVTKATSFSTKTRILMTLFKKAYCSVTCVTVTQETQSEEGLQLLSKNASTAFTKSLGRLWDEQELLDKIFEDIYSVATTNDEEIKFNGNDPALSLWKKAAKVDFTNPIYSKCLRLLLILLLTGEIKTENSAVGLLKLASQSEEKQNAKVAQLILTTMFEDNASMINFTPALRTLFQNETILQSSLSFVLTALDPENIPDETEESSDDDDEDDTTSMGSMDVKKIAEMLKTSTNQDESESDIDMDEAPEEELQKMDEALANVFSTKKQAKEQETTDLKVLMKACRIIELMLKIQKIPPSSVIPQLLMPLMSCVVKSSKSTNPNNTQLHIKMAKTLKTINAVKKVKEPSLVDTDVIDGLTQDVKDVLRKNIPKGTKKVIRGSISMLSKCYNQAAIKVEPSEDKPAKFSNSKNKKGIKRKKGQLQELAASAEEKKASNGKNAKKQKRHMS